MAFFAGAKSGVQEGDQLLMVNGVDCRDLTHQQVVKLLGKRGKKLKLVVCQPKVYQWYLKQGYELKLDYDDEQENVQDNNQHPAVKQLTANSQINRTKLNDGFNTNQQPPISYNERCVDDIRPIQVHDQIIPYVDNNLNKDNLYKDSQINQHHQSTTAINDDPFSSRNSFKRSYKLKKNRPSQSHTHLYAGDDAVDESLSMSTSVSPFDERYGELRDDIFNSRSSKTPNDRSKLNKNLSRSVTDNYNYESKNIEYNEYMDSSSHKLEKSETTVEILNDEFQNKKFTRKSIERLQKQYDDQPKKTVPQQMTTRKDEQSRITTTNPTAATTSVSTTTRSSYTPIYSKTSAFSNSLFDKPKTTSSIFDRPSSIFDRPSIFDNKYENKFDSNKLTSADKQTTASKTSYLSPNYNNTNYNQSSYNTQSYSSSNYKNESSYSKSYISPLSNQTTTTTRPYKSPLSSSPKTYEPTYNIRQQTAAKEPYIERHVIEPKEAQLVHIDHEEDEQNRVKQTKNNQPQVQHQPHQVKGTKTLKTVQANTPNDLPAPRLCTLRLPKDRIVSFGFTIKTSRKTNAKVIVDIVRNSIAHRAGKREMCIIFKILK